MKRKSVVKSYNVYEITTFRDSPGMTSDRVYIQARSIEQALKEATGRLERFEKIKSITLHSVLD